MEAAERARRVLADLDHLVARPPQQAGIPAAACAWGLYPRWRRTSWPRCCGRWAGGWPDLHLQVTEDQTARLLDDLSAGDLDAIVLALPTGAAGVVEVPLYWEDFVLLVPPEHPLAGKVGLSRAVLRTCACCCSKRGIACRARSSTSAARSGRRPTTRLGPPRSPPSPSWWRPGSGHTLLPATALPVETRKGKLAVARFRPPAPGRRIGLVFRAGNGRAGEYYRLAEHIKRGLDGPGFAGQLEVAAPGSEPARVARVC